KKAPDHLVPAGVLAEIEESDQMPKLMRSNRNTRRSLGYLGDLLGQQAGPLVTFALSRKQEAVALFSEKRTRPSKVDLKDLDEPMRQLKFQVDIILHLAGRKYKMTSLARAVAVPDQVALKMDRG